MSREETEEKASFLPSTIPELFGLVQDPQTPRPGGGGERNGRFQQRTLPPGRIDAHVGARRIHRKLLHLVHDKQLLSCQAKSTIKERSGATGGKQGGRGKKVTEQPEERLAC